MNFLYNKYIIPRNIDRKITVMRIYKIIFVSPEKLLILHLLENRNSLML